MSGMSSMRRFRVAMHTFNVVVRLPDDLEKPVKVDVRASDAEGDLCLAELRWRREYTDEQRSGNVWKDELPAFTAAELLLAACGGAVPDSVEVVKGLGESFDEPRRLLAGAIASATIESALSGQEAKLPEGLLYDLSAGRRED